MKVDGVDRQRSDIAKLIWSVPEVVANVAWGGGPKRNILYICGTTSLYAVRLMINGAKTV